jgi:hypothetical protein
MSLDNPIQENPKTGGANRPADEDTHHAEPPLFPSATGLQPPPPPSCHTASEQEPNWRKNITLAMEIVGLVILIVYTAFAGCQWKVANETLTEIRNGKSDTNRIITASETQAGAATKIAGAATTFSASAAKIGQETANAVGELRRSADDAEKAIDKSSRNAQRALDASVEASRIDQRAWVGLLFPVETVDKKKIEVLAPFAFKLRFKNTGKTPALRISYDPLIVFRAPNQPIPDYDQETKENIFYRLTGINESALLAPGEEVFITFPALRPNGPNLALGPDKFNWMNTYQEVMFIVGKVSYHDIFPNTPPRTTKFCLIYEPKFGEVGACPTNRAMD